MTDYFFGELPGEPVGTVYENRAAATKARVHQVTQQGIAGNRKDGCASIVLSGGYPTDEDYGHEIFYTGAGGQDPKDRKVQIAHQDLGKSDNAALVRSQETGLPIRIIRGAGHPGQHAPPSGYRYDGLFRAVTHYENYPEDGFRRWMFHLVQLDAQEAAIFTPDENFEADNRAYEQLGIGSGLLGVSTPLMQATQVAPPDLMFIELTIPPGNTYPGTKTIVSQRVVRDTKVSMAVKAMYANSCQVCGTQIETGAGHYSEGAHIRGLGKPHHGPDVMNNILCLCPNHHAAFDKGGLYLADDLSAITAKGEVVGALSVHPDHMVDLNCVRYHRSYHGHSVGTAS